MWPSTSKHAVWSVYDTLITQCLIETSVRKRFFSTELILATFTCRNGLDLPTFSSGRNVPFHWSMNVLPCALSLVMIIAPQPSLSLILSHVCPLMNSVMSGDSMSASQEIWEPQLQVQPNWIFMINALIRFHPRCSTASTYSWHYNHC